MKIRIGVLALQVMENHFTQKGAYIEHKNMLQSLGSDITVIEIREAYQLDSVDGLLIPGGESTAIAILIEQSSLLDPLISFTKSKPTWGTCAGLILLANKIENAKQGGQSLIGGFDISVKRNAFGSQADSFSCSLPTKLFKDPFPAVFIRAPIISSILSSNVDILATRDDNIVAVRQDNLLGTSFHPELTLDTRFHAYFVEMVKLYVNQTRFINWIHLNGVNTDTISLRKSNLTSLSVPSCGLFLQKPIETNTILEIPLKITLSAHKVFEFNSIEWNSFIESIIKTIPENDSLPLYIYLIYIRFYTEPITTNDVQDIMFWSLYIHSLPSNLNDLPINWSNENDLESAGIHKMVNGKLKRLKYEFDQCYPLVSDYFQQSSNQVIDFSYEMYKWADSIIRSRTIELNEPTLVPFFDYFNHSNETNVAWEITQSINNKPTETPTYSLSIYPTQVSHPNDELFITYGNKSNTELLYSYGFIQSANPYNLVYLSIQFMKDDPLIKEKQEWLMNRGCKPMITIHQPRNELNGLNKILDENDIISLYITLLNNRDLPSIDIDIVDIQCFVDVSCVFDVLLRLLDEKIKDYQIGLNGTSLIVERYLKYQIDTLNCSRNVLITLME